MTALTTEYDPAVEDVKPARRGIAILKVSLIGCCMAAIYGLTLKGMVTDWWTDSSFSQGFLIAPLSVYIAWLRKTQLARQPILPDSRGLLVVAASGVMFLLGKLGAEFFLTRVSFVVAVVGLIGTLWGRKRLRVLAFPLALLATAIPLPAIVYASITAPLQLFASSVAANLAQMFGTTVFRDGNIIHLANTSLGVEEACSGLNSLSSLVVASLLLGFMLLVRPAARLLLVFLAVPLAIAVNVMRITGTAILADYHAEFAQGFYHLFSGWLVFVMGFGMLYVICLGLGRCMERAG